MFLVCGEALFDVFAVARTPTGLSLDARVGGSPFNLAVGLARLAQPVSLLTTVSNGFLGERLMQALREEGVGTHTAQRSDAPTTLSLVGTDAAGVPSYAFYGDGGADRWLAPEAVVDLPDATHAICLGSYTTVVGETAHSLRALVERHRHRALIAYDPNVRLNVQPDAAVWREQLRWMLPRADLLKVSEEDLALIDGRAPQAFAHEALASGVSLVVVTRGAYGAVAWTARHHAEVPAPAVDVVDTVGAGDTFQAALLTWLAERGALGREALGDLSAPTLHSALGFATQAAAITCGRRGADLPRRAELPAT
ncbi:MAG: carbohydrate kinase [Hydrogenophaga sp.]|uniref:carbohydrate kinase family protein n=1 Tax=Hydrogenophaga sp. TaxID=1904254 RepID=UPI001692872F|nr:carbohydrate kinase [Hydrogenophaga sp.]NIM43866.1 carbohydrate kinase [Hydrogenophaga sp.]NIN28932.1 carbohydrate kinase [Hydrogenophaga sp.]NIN33391.1 carbohydrate kinase [Hydrogenophaga sp.]NIN58066.1 carbohydrate kinase [Hydrogenophaga sp.]NIO54364.1 carbohydrate kinase [Hydrogenophaga sp.]